MKNTAVAVIALLFVLTCMTSLCEGYSYVQAGVASTFLIDEGRLFFAQSDGSLTVLSLETGDVLVRDKSMSYSGTLLRTDYGILVLGSRKITLLHSVSLNKLWDTESHWEPNVTCDALVSYDGDGLVHCRSLKNGDVRWTYELPGALDIIVESDMVLVHSAAAHVGMPATALLDMETGKELFRKTPQPGIHHEAVFFDGTNIYLASGRFSGKRSECKIDHLVVWDILGEEIDSIPLPAKLQEVTYSFIGSFKVGDRVFSGGRVYRAGQTVPARRPGRRTATRRWYDDRSRVTEHEYLLEDGVLLARHWCNSLRIGGRNDQPPTIEVRTTNFQWKGMLPYLTKRGSVSRIGEANGRILIGTNMGHVECVDATTGESLWMYIFPTRRHTVAYSSSGMPPTMADAAATYRRENTRRPPESGLQLVGNSRGASKPKIVLDPDPADPFRRLPFYLAVAWAGAAIPFLIAGVRFIIPKIRQRDPRVLGLAFVVLTGAALYFYVFYGRVSPGSSMLLKLAVVTCVAVGVYDVVKSYRHGKWLSASLLGLFFAAVSLFILPALWPL